MSTITINPGDNIQKAINSAASGTTIVFNAGTYNVSKVINLKSGVSLQGAPGAVLKSSGSVGIFQGLGVHDINISGLTFDGNNKGPSNSGAIYLDSSSGGASGTPSNNIHISNNTFQNWLNKDSANLWLWHTQNTYVQGNTFKNGNEAVGWSTDAGAPPLNNLVVSGNTITGMKYIGIETAFDSTVSNVHIDYNKISNIGDMSISFVEGAVGGKVMSGTVWGNQIDASRSGGTPVELGNYNGPFNVTVSQNVISNHEWGMMFSHTAGMAVFGNTFKNVQNPFSDDGGYDKTEWIGTNTINGAQQTGWPGHKYGAEPATYSPSPAPSGTTSTLSAALSDTQQQTSAAVGASSADSTSTKTSTATDTAAADTTAAGTAATDTTASDTAAAGTTASDTTASDTTTAGTSASDTTATGATASDTTATGTTDPSAAPVQPDTVLGKLWAHAGFHNPASASRDSAAGAAASGTQSRHGADTLAQLAGGSLKADLTNVGGLDKALAAVASHAGSGAPTQPGNGIGGALSSLDQSGKPHDAVNPDTWRQHA